MKYERSYFKDDMFPAAKLHLKPELPKIKFKDGGITYSVTDIRYLNESAISVFQNCVITAATVPNAKGYKFRVPKDFDNSDNKLDLIVDIVTAIGYEAEKSGKNGFKSDGCLLCVGCSCTTEKNGDKVYEIEFAREHAKTIYEYAQTLNGSKNELSILDIVIAIETASREQMETLLKTDNGEVKT